MVSYSLSTPFFGAIVPSFTASTGSKALLKKFNTSMRSWNESFVILLIKLDLKEANVVERFINDSKPFIITMKF